MILSHILPIIIPSSPDCIRCWPSLLPLIFQGIALSTYYVVVWGALPLMVEDKYLGTAYGICASFENKATTLSPIASGKI